MDETFKNDKMYTTWDIVANEWCFYHANGVAVLAFESLEKILIRPHSIAESLLSLHAQKHPQFGSFFQYPPITISEKASHGVRSLGKAVKSPEISIPGIVAIVTGVMTFLILNLNTPTPYTNSTLANATNSADMVGSIKLNYTAVTLSMLIAMAVLNVIIATYKKYNEPVPDSKFIMKKIEKEIEEKEKIISAFIHFMRRKLENFLISKNDISAVITAFEAPGTPNLYIKIKKSIEFFSTPGKTEHLKILELILNKLLNMAGMDPFLGAAHPLQMQPIANVPKIDKFSLILRILENTTLISFVEKINSLLNLQLNNDLILELYRNLDVLSNEHPFIFELIKNTPLFSHLEIKDIPQNLLVRLSSNNPEEVLNTLSDLKELLERHSGNRPFLSQ